MPHTHMEIAPRGSSLPCCAYKTQLLRKKDDIETFLIPSPNVSKASLANIFDNHPYWKDARRRSLKNEFNPACQQCHMEEKAGLESYRLSNNKKFGKYISEIEGDRKLLSLELKLGAKCNLACRTCSSSHSNMLLKEDSIKVWGNINKDWIRDMQSKSDWAQDENFWKRVYNVSKDLKYIKFTGGEPLIIEKHFEYLDWLVKNNLDIEIGYITNGTVKLSERIKNIWDKFSHVHMSVSIDAVGDLEEYMRTGCVWEEQKQNIKDYVDFLGITNVGITCTVSTLNVHKIPDFINYFNDTGIQIVFNILTHPEHLGIRNLKQPAKDYLNSVYNNLINTNEHILSEQTLHGIDNIKNSFNRKHTLNGDELNIPGEITRKDSMYNLANKNKRHSYKELEPDWFEILEKGEIC